ncbi:hypothetical protein TNCV_74811 [Trichonephila clavipes]|nr:hypothetical protein TNCV_74811 [Trichonephila clavipes]
MALSGSLPQINLGVQGNEGAWVLRNQYPEQSPLTVITPSVRQDIESNRGWMACTGTDVHAASTRCHSSPTVGTRV